MDSDEELRNLVRRVAAGDKDAQGLLDQAFLRLGRPVVFSVTNADEGYGAPSDGLTFNVKVEPDDTEDARPGELFVAIFDARRKSKANPLGQPIWGSGYWASTLLDHESGTGLAMYTPEPAWELDGPAMDEVVRRLEGMGAVGVCGECDEPIERAKAVRRHGHLVHPACAKKRRGRRNPDDERLRGLARRASADPSLLPELLEEAEAAGIRQLGDPAWVILSGRRVAASPTDEVAEAVGPFDRVEAEVGRGEVRLRGIVGGRPTALASFKVGSDFWVSKTDVVLLDGGKKAGPGLHFSDIVVATGFRGGRSTGDGDDPAALWRRVAGGDLSVLRRIERASRRGKARPSDEPVWARFLLRPGDPPDLVMGGAEFFQFTYEQLRIGPDGAGVAWAERGGFDIILDGLKDARGVLPDGVLSFVGISADNLRSQGRRVVTFDSEPPRVGEVLLVAL